MTRATWGALIAVAAMVVGVLAGSPYVIRQYTESVVARYAEQRLAQVTDVASVVEDDISNITADLMTAGQLYQEGASEDDRRKVLTTMVRIVEEYKRISLYDHDGRLLLSAEDPLHAIGEPPALFDGPVNDIVRSALESGPGNIETTAPILGKDPYRAYATSIATRSGAPIVVVIVLATKPTSRKLHVLAAGGDALLVLLGPHGRASPVSSPTLKQAVDGIDADAAELPGLSTVVAGMRRGEGGTGMLGEEEAQHLGLPRAQAIAAYAVVNVEGGEHWSIATVSSVRALQAQQRQLVERVVLIAGALIVLIITFGVYVVSAMRRATTMRERLRVVDRLAHLHELTEKILDNIPVGVIALAADGRTTAINRALRERSPGVQLGVQLEDALSAAPPAVVRRLVSLVDACLATGTVRSVHGEQLSLFGREGRYSIHAVPLDRPLADARALLVIDDVSEVHTLASQLVRAEKLGTVGVLGAGIAHEIGTPLGVIRGRAERVLSKLGEDHPQAPGVGVIVDQIDVVTRTIQKLLDFSRVKPILVQSVGVARAASAVAELLGFEANRRKIKVEVDVHEAIPAVAADGDQLQQVLVNLVMNAFDACAPGGRVVISARAERSEVASSPPVLRISVTDDGCGIPKQDQEQIFDPFFTTKKRGQGTGLGLTVVAHIVRSHSGHIEIESEPARGTTVTLVWPCASAEGRHAATA